MTLFPRVGQSPLQRSLYLDRRALCREMKLTAAASSVTLGLNPDDHTVCPASPLHLGESLCLFSLFSFHSLFDFSLTLLSRSPLFTFPFSPLPNPDACSVWGVGGWRLYGSSSPTLRLHRGDAAQQTNTDLLFKSSCALCIFGLEQFLPNVPRSGISLYLSCLFSPVFSRCAG